MWKRAAMAVVLCVCATAPRAETCEEREALLALTDRTRMVYTYGRLAVYEPLLDRCVFRKRGRDLAGRHGKPYRGGLVFRTEDEVRAYLATKGWTRIRGIYGVLADWDADTYEIPGKPGHRLLRDAFVVRLAPRAVPNVPEAPEPAGGEEGSMR